MPHSDEIRVAAPAKLNLYLRVVGRRDDGYHLLDSLVAFADTHDSLIATADDRLSLAIEGPFALALAGDADNLVLRAARLLATVAGIAPRVRLHLIKRLPVAAGIGGGSADAAAALIALDRLWNLGLGRTALAAMALGLGADLPVCVRGRAARVTGIGETIEPVGGLPGAGLVLVNPGVALSTPEIFAARSGTYSVPVASNMRMLGNTNAAGLAAFLAPLGNDLTVGARHVAPVVGSVLDCLSASDGCLLARMSGSGATCFGLYDDPSTARAAASTLVSANPGWWVTAASLLHDAADLIPVA